MTDVLARFSHECIQTEVPEHDDEATCFLKKAQAQSDRARGFHLGILYLECQAQLERIERQCSAHSFRAPPPYRRE